MNCRPPYGRVAVPGDRTKHGRVAVPGDRHGSVLMEFLLVFPIILLLVSMLLQFAQIWIARQITAYAAYCATRATLCVNKDEQTTAAQYAAESVCAWMCYAGLSTDEAATLQEVSHAPLNWNKYHDMTDEVANDDTIYKDVSAPRSAELNIPGWGSVPGSSSRHVRVQTNVIQGGASGDYAAVQVRFKFPLLLPLAGKIISWAASHPYEAPSTYNRNTGTWTGDSYYSIHSGWHRGKETVMDDGGNAVDRSYATYGQDGRFPFIELTEICVLPRPYLTKNFKDGRYNYGGGS